MPTWAEVRDRVQELAIERGEYGGYPVPVHNARIATSERHGGQHQMDGATLGRYEDEEPPEFRCGDLASDGFRIRNEWWSRRLQCPIAIIEVDGKIEAVTEAYSIQLGALRRWQRLLNTMDAGRQAWDMRAEMRAVVSLAELIEEHQFETYMTTGMFVESSTRSQCAYVFRKGRPTVVMQPNGAGGYGARVTLCLHPLAYYEDTFAGGMVPTDDVIAHLLLMRADEPRLWRQSNQHPIDRPEAGI